MRINVAVMITPQKSDHSLKLFESQQLERWNTELKLAQQQQSFQKSFKTIGWNLDLYFDETFDISVKLVLKWA